MSPIRRSKTEIGKLLVQKGIINEDQLKEALSHKYEQGKDKTLGQILLELGHIKREDVHYALAVQSGYPYIKVGSCRLSHEVQALIPSSFIKKHRVLPIDKIDGRIS